MSVKIYSHNYVLYNIPKLKAIMQGGKILITYLISHNSVWM